MEKELLTTNSSYEDKYVKTITYTTQTIQYPNIIVEQSVDRQIVRDENEIPRKRDSEIKKYQ